MFLTSLQLLGFKTFARQTEIHFDGGVTAIVGPNGSGKTNIVDSIKWVLGSGQARDIRAAVKPGGWLIWETFADGQQTIGRPSRPDFLLQRGELLRICGDWRIVAYEDLFEGGVNPRFVQRVAAIRPPPAA